ncbi:hypothetical protein Hanom_Chr10g00956921 [Helianthus anomalus]
MEGGVGTKAPERPEYVNLSEYPPGTDIEYELHYDGCRVVSKVPRWAHEKWLLKYQNAGDQEEDHPHGTIPPQDTSPIGKRRCEDHPNSVSATAAASSGAMVSKKTVEACVPRRASGSFYCMCASEGAPQGF